MIFTVFAIAENEKLKGRPVSVLIICPLKSITSDQILQLEGLPSVAEFTPESSKKIHLLLFICAKYTIIYVNS